jgi:hypothetical protein
MKRIIFLIGIVLIFSACKDKESFSINGEIKNSKNKYIYINRLDIDTPILIDSAKIHKNGKFSFRIKASETDFYQLGFSTSDFVTLLAKPGQRININFRGKNLFENYSVKGSEESEKIRVLDNNLAVTKRKLDSLSTLYAEAASQPGFESRRPELEDQFTTTLKDQRKKNITFIIENINSLASIKALYQKINPETYVLYDPRDLQYMKIATDSLTKYYPNSKHVQALARDFNKEMTQMYTNQIGDMAKNIPEVKLDPNLLDTEGRRIALSSLRGKYVLLTFWSARSRDCIQENLQLKEYYKNYKNRGFEIYQISLDPVEAEWKAAVRFDELPWINTREDDPNDPFNAKLFNVRSLPYNYLFDKEGKIIAANIHGRALQIKLNQLFD